MSLRPVEYKPEKDGIWKPIPISSSVGFDICPDIQLEVGVDIDNEEVIFKVEMPVGAHMALGYGAKTTYCDMLLFQAHMEHSRVLDCYHHDGEPEYIDK